MMTDNPRFIRWEVSEFRAETEKTLPVWLLKIKILRCLVKVYLFHARMKRPPLIKFDGRLKWNRGTLFGATFRAALVAKQHLRNKEICTLLQARLAASEAMSIAQSHFVLGTWSAEPSAEDEYIATIAWKMAARTPNWPQGVI